MAIELRLSTRPNPKNGLEVKIRFYFRDGEKKCECYAGSSVFVQPEYFEYYIDRKKTEAEGVQVPAKAITATVQTAAKKGYVLRDGGEIVVNKRVDTDEVKQHREQAEKMENLKKYIDQQFKQTDRAKVNTKWLKEVVRRFHYPAEEHAEPQADAKTLYPIVEKYIEKKKLAGSNARMYRVLSRTAARYAGFVRETDKNRVDFEWNIDTVTKEDIEDFADYLRNEKDLAGEYPQIFKRLLEKYPPDVTKGRGVIHERGANTVKKMLTRLKTLFKALAEGEVDGVETTNRPFDGVKIGASKYGTPVYITIAERNKIAEADLAAGWPDLLAEWQKRPCKERPHISLKTVTEQRDIFVFHCLVGCRVGDLTKLTPEHVNGGVLVYTPHKTKDKGETQRQARVPLLPQASALIKKYAGADNQGRLFPFITPQRYNDALKIIFKLAGVTRPVEVRNTLTGENEIVSIDTIASSHMARRTFVGNLYFKVQDPDLIGKMSGHVEGSSAFARYRKIEDETLKNAIDLIG